MRRPIILIRRRLLQSQSSLFVNVGEKNGSGFVAKAPWTNKYINHNLRLQQVQNPNPYHDFKNKNNNKIKGRIIM